MPAHQALRHRLVAAALLVGEFGKAEHAARIDLAVHADERRGRSSWVSSSSASQAARMSANSVLPPLPGIVRACSSEYFAGVGLNELSECHSMLPRLNSRRRSSRARISLSLPRFEMSPISGASRRSSSRRMSALAVSSVPEMAAERELLLVVDLLVVEDQHGEFVHALADRARSRRRSRSGDRSMPDDLAGEERAVDGVDRAD